MPRLRKIPHYERMGRDVWQLFVGCLLYGRLECFDGHYVWTPKSNEFQSKVFHDFEEAKRYLLENS